MNRNASLKTALAGLILTACTAWAPMTLAHDVPGIEHTHAFKQTGYGTYREGHSVNGPQGSIIIWSAQPKTGYPPGQAVQFARPQPITKAPAPAIKKPTPGSMKPQFIDTSKKKR